MTSTLVSTRCRPSSHSDLYSLVATMNRNPNIADHPAPAPEKQDISALDPRMQSVLRKHGAPGGTLGPNSPN
jgi:hypothetical protein